MMRCTFKPLLHTVKTGTLFAAVCIAASVSATSASSTISNGVKWVDGRMLPLEGKYFDDVDSYYDRFPGHASPNINVGVWKLKSNTAGMQFRFRTDSKRLIFRWTPTSARRIRPDHRPRDPVGQSRCRRRSWKLVESDNPDSGGLCRGKNRLEIGPSHVVVVVSGPVRFYAVRIRDKNRIAGRQHWHHVRNLLGHVIGMRAAHSDKDPHPGNLVHRARRAVSTPSGAQTAKVP